MKERRVVVDTNVLFAGLYSSTGASHQILRLIDDAVLVPLLSTALLFEYEDVLRRSQEQLRLSDLAVEDVLDALCVQGESRKIHFLWRPQLPDPKDDHVLELAVAASGADIVTHNRKDFAGAETLGVRILAPAELLGELK
jgi:putative PIN family toxin of toxin-antitoxin system